MIKNTEPLAMAEVLGYLSKDDENLSELRAFIKKFIKITPKQALEMKKKLQDLNLIKLNEQDIIKLIDFMPEDVEELNKVIQNNNLDENERAKIFEIIKEFK